MMLAKLVPFASTDSCSARIDCLSDECEPDIEYTTFDLLVTYTKIKIQVQGELSEHSTIEV
jgi:hypothetical protein